LRAADDNIAAQRLSPQEVRAILANIVPRIDDYVYSKTGLSAQQEEDLVNGLTDAAMSVMEKRGAGAATMTIKDVLDEMNASGAAPGAMGIGSTFEADLREWLRTNAPPARP
jgi:phenylpyruvate tautomerase PptA (4-oxalocrotonate tautomerase family)